MMRARIENIKNENIYIYAQDVLAGVFFLKYILDWEYIHLGLVLS